MAEGTRSGAADPGARARIAQTIAAIASPPGGALRGIVRLSGPGAKELVAACVRFEHAAALSARGVWPGVLDDGCGEQPVLVFWMPAPHSYTREDVAELHGPGAMPLVEAALRRVLALGARAAEPGEFTRRAFENGQLDLTRAEGVLELVRASNERQLRAASALLSGGLERRVEALRERLVELRVLCEASLDFDEADTGHVPWEELAQRIAAALEELDSTRSFEERRATLSARPRAVLMGAPNAGKSTLFNALCGAQALVSDAPGATRDVLRGNWAAAGASIELMDTAGLADADGGGASDDPDAQAQRATRGALAGADLVLVVASAARADAPALEGLVALLAELGSELAPAVLVWSQIDRLDACAGPPPQLLAAIGAAPLVCVSASTGAGLEQLAEVCRERLASAGPGLGSHGAEGLGLELAERHVAALERCRSALERARDDLHGGAPLDQLAQTLREALDALDAISGRTSPEDLLDRLFARFCIGK